MADEQEIVMEVYAGLFLVTIGIGYLVARAFQSSSSTAVVKDRDTGSPSIRHQSRRRKQNGSIGLASSGSRDYPTDRTTAIAHKRAAFVTGAIQKPWGW